MLSSLLALLKVFQQRSKSQEDNEDSTDKSQTDRAILCDTPKKSEVVKCLNYYPPIKTATGVPFSKASIV